MAVQMKQTLCAGYVVSVCAGCTCMYVLAFDMNTERGLDPLFSILLT